MIQSPSTKILLPKRLSLGKRAPSSFHHVKLLQELIKYSFLNHTYHNILEYIYNYTKINQLRTNMQYISSNLSWKKLELETKKNFYLNLIFCQ